MQHTHNWLWLSLSVDRYNPNNPLPEWYTPVDVESDREMWK